MKWFSGFVLFISLGLSSSTSFCPDYEDISPCSCERDAAYRNTNMYCNDATSESEIEDAFLASFPEKDLTKFYIINNHDIEGLTHSLFNGVTFETIDLLNNNLAHIDATFFVGQEERLTQIFATENSLGNEGFPYSALPSLRNVYLLDLRENGITSLPVPIPPNNLTKIYYHTNDIETIEEGTFENCQILDYLILYDNSMKSISPGKNFLLNIY